MKNVPLTLVIEREGDGFVSLCPELDIASQGDTASEARHNLSEALELFLEAADESEVGRRLSGEAGTGAAEIYDMRITGGIGRPPP